jgi:plastocyanin
LANDRAGDQYKEINLSSLAVTTAPKQGTAVVNNDGTITYTPSAYFVGTDSLVYQVCDNNNPVQCEKAVAYFKIEATGVTPVTTAADDYISTVASATGANTVSGTVLLNDQNSGGGNLTASLISGPTAAQGTLVFNTDGTYSFTPAAGFVGPINIVYEVCGGSPVDCAKATLHILVNPAPTLVDDAATAYINIEKTGNVSTNDVVPTGTTYGQPAQITGANIVVGASGTYTFTATAAGTYTYTIPVCAPGQIINCPTETLVITVPVNNLVDDAATAFTNIPKPGNVSTNDVVPTGTTYGQPAQITGATIVVDASGTYTFTATAAGTYTYTIPVCAPGQTVNCPTQTLVITVPVNVLVDDAATAYINIAKPGNVSANDVVPTGTTYGQPAQITGATIVVGASGTYTFTATAAGTYT